MMHNFMHSCVGVGCLDIVLQNHCVFCQVLSGERERDEQERKTLRITAHEKPDHRLLLLSKSRNVTMMTGSYLKLCCY